MKQLLNCCNLQSGIFKVNKHQFSLGQEATFKIQFQLHKTWIFNNILTVVSLTEVLKYMLICQLVEDDEIFSWIYTLVENYHFGKNLKEMLP